MIKSILTAAALALLLAGPAIADDDDHRDRRGRGDDRDHRYDRDDHRGDWRDHRRDDDRRHDRGRQDNDWNRRPDTCSAIPARLDDSVVINVPLGLRLRRT
jgi:hypothetical protein